MTTDEGRPALTYYQAVLVPISGRVVAAATNPVQFDTSRSPVAALTITNTSTVTAVDIGGPSVTTGNGFALAAGASVTWVFPTGTGPRLRDLFCVTASSTASICFMGWA